MVRCFGLYECRVDDLLIFRRLKQKNATRITSEKVRLALEMHITPWLLNLTRGNNDRNKWRREEKAQEIKMVETDTKQFWLDSLRKGFEDFISHFQSSNPIKGCRIVWFCFIGNFYLPDCKRNQLKKLTIKGILGKNKNQSLSFNSFLYDFYNFFILNSQLIHKPFGKALWYWCCFFTFSDIFTHCFRNCYWT